MADIELLIKINEETYQHYKKVWQKRRGSIPESCIAFGTPLTPYMLADALMEERIRGKLDSDITFEKDVIPDVKCRLTVDIIDNRPCYCGAELREVWRESEVEE